jgi:hypothetical protein
MRQELPDCELNQSEPRFLLFPSSSSCLGSVCVSDRMCRLCWVECPAQMANLNRMNTWDRMCVDMEHEAFNGILRTQVQTG